MKRIILIAALAAFSLSAQEVAAKPETPPATVKATLTTPSLATAKLWRLLSKAQELRRVAAETPQAKEAAAAEAEVQAEQGKLAQVCTAANMVLGFQQDQKADNAGDLICQVRPPAPVEAKK